MTTVHPQSMTGERKQVTILFADISGFTAMSEQNDPEVVRERINTCFSRLAPIVKQHSGTIEKYIGDEIMAIFGAPIMHENDAELAALAALEMMDALKVFNQEFGTNLGIHMGINTGAVIAGGIGAQGDLQYGVLGDAVNVASRLADAAERGQIFVGENTNRLIASVFEMESLEPIRLRGKSEPVAVFQLKGMKEKPGKVRGLEGYGLLSPLIGRNREIATIQECINSTIAGMGGILVIIGEAGLGKTRLVEEAVKRFILHSGYDGEPSPRILEGATLSYGQSISFWPFQEVLRQYAEITEQDSGPAAWEKLENRLGALFPGESDKFLPYLASLLALEAPGEWGKRLQYLDSDALGKQIFLAARNLFEALVKERPLILVFEDMHWLDETSTRLLEYILPLVKAYPILIIGLSRPNLNSPTAQLQTNIIQKYPSYYQEIHLTPLSSADSDLLARNLLQLKEIPTRLRDNLIEKAEGNPFFLEEVVRTLIEAKAILRDPSTNSWKITEEVTKIAIPDTIQGVIMARIDRLDEEVKHVLRLAAVIGRSFLYSVLKAIEVQVDHLDEDLSELQQVELILERRRDPELEYIFRHALAQEATYESILHQQRRELHDRVGKAIEELFSDRLEEFYGLLAYHYARAEAWEKAHSFLLKAGDEAGRMAADAEALNYYQQAMDAYQRLFGDQWEPVERASLERKIGEALWRHGEQLQALEHLEMGISYLGISIPRKRFRIYLGIMKEAIRQLGYRLFPRFFLPGISSVPSQEVVEEVSIYEVIAWIEAFDNAERFLLCALRELNTAEKNGFDLGVVLSSTGVGVLGLFIPIYPLAKRYLDLAADTAKRIDSPIAKGMIHYGLALYELCMGKLDQAAVHGRSSIAFYEQARDLHDTFVAKVFQALILCYQGQLLQGQLLVEEMVNQSREVSDQMGVAQGEVAQGLAAFSLGEYPDKTIAILEHTLESCRPVSYYMGIVLSLGVLGRCYIRKGDIPQALEALQNGKKVAVEHQMVIPFIVSYLYIGFAEVYLMAAEHGGVEEKAIWMKKAKRACRELMKHSKILMVEKPEAFRLQGVYEWLMGSPVKAQLWWEKSLRKAEDLGMPYHAALTRLEIGKRLGDGEQLKKAEVKLRDLGVNLENI
jgi:class 3 adenylate cyclase/tetratricopeptide (TPR) repeat protein